MAASAFRSLATCYVLLVVLVTFLSAPPSACASLRGSPHRAAVPTPSTAPRADRQNVTYELVGRVDDNYAGETNDADLITLERPLNVTLDEGGTSLYTLPAGSLVLLNAGRPGARGMYGWASTPNQELGRQFIRFYTNNDNPDILGQTEITSCTLAAPLTSFVYVSGMSGDNLLTYSRNLTQWSELDGRTPNISQYTASSCEIDNDGCMRFFFGQGLVNHYPYPNNHNTLSWKGCPAKDVKEGGVAWTLLGNNTLAPHYYVKTAVHRHNVHLNNQSVFYAVDGLRDVYNPKVNGTLQTVTSHVSASLDGATWYTLLSEAQLPWTSASSLVELLAITSNGVIVFTDTGSGVWASVDGGLSFGQCSGPPAYGERALASTAFDLSGRQYVLGGVKAGLNQPDVWRSNDVIWTDVKSVASYCNITVPQDGLPGLRQWPPIKPAQHRHARTE